MQSNELAHTAAKLILDKKGQDVVIMDLRKLTTMADYFVICTADSEIQMKTVKDYIADQLYLQSIKPWHIEGESSNWILLDYVDVVIHLFQPEARQFYGLENLWGDAVFTEIKDENDTSGLH